MFHVRAGGVHLVLGPAQAKAHAQAAIGEKVDRSQAAP